MRRWVVFASLTTVLLISGGAAAQTSSKEKMEQIEFPDDKLLSPGNFAGEMKIGTKLPTVRTILTRPRTHFVPEMLKTIESL